MTGTNVVLGGIAWSVFTLLFFMLFSITPPGEDSPFWYLLGTYILETAPFFLATWLCYRNWQSPQIASGREVWLFIGLGMACYSIANVLFGIWELYFGLDPEISPADLFYLGFTILVGWGMILAVLPRRLNLEVRQWLIVVGIAAAGILLSIWASFGTEDQDAFVPALPLMGMPAAHAQVTVAQNSPPAAPPVQTAPNNAPPVDPNVQPVPTAPAPDLAVEEEEEANAPGIILALDRFLANFARPVNTFYTISDVALMIIAATLLLAFWGGRFSQSWRMIAAAALAKYVADLAFKLATKLPGDYESGGLFEVFYVFGGVLYCMGAALEFDVSTSRTGRGRRRRGGT
ncbi:MAG: hypothetical protein F6J87_02485 [Spirulina sp. SIO3F2]|nr:hypothetical protein [Spirulina sp. SIO3F2]